MKLEVPSRAVGVKIMTRNIVGVNSSTFSFVIRKAEEGSGTNFVYIVISSAFCVLSFVICTSAIMKCCIRNNGLDFNVDVPNPRWDSDQM